MESIRRYEQYKDECFDTIINKIKQGKIKCGRYSKLVKIDKDIKVNGKELFSDDDSESE